MSRPGVIVSLTSNALQFLAGADQIVVKYADLEIYRGPELVSVYRSGMWEHAARISDFPGGLTQDPQTNIWVIDTPEVNRGLPDAPPPES